MLGLVCLVALGLAVPLALVPRPGRASVVARPARTVAGTPIHGVLLVSAGRLPALSPAVEVGGLVGRSMRLATVRPGRPREEVFEVPAQRRGVYDLGPVRLVQSDPLGLVRRHRTWAQPTEVLVRPVVTPLEAGSMAGRPDLEGMPSEQLSLSDLAFHSLREYVPGDDLRHVHWRSSAKADQLLVRQYLESRSMQAAVLLDAEPGSYRTDDEFELAVSIAASVAVQALADGVHVTLTCGARVVEAESPDALLDACCRLVTDGSTVAGVRGGPRRQPGQPRRRGVRRHGQQAVPGRGAPRPHRVPPAQRPRGAPRRPGRTRRPDDLARRTPRRRHLARPAAAARGRGDAVTPVPSVPQAARDLLAVVTLLGLALWGLDDSLSSRSYLAVAAIGLVMVTGLALALLAAERSTALFLLIALPGVRRGRVDDRPRLVHAGRRADAVRPGRRAGGDDHRAGAAADHDPARRRRRLGAGAAALPGVRARRGGCVDRAAEPSPGTATGAAPGGARRVHPAGDRGAAGARGPQPGLRGRVPGLGGVAGRRPPADPAPVAGGDGPRRGRCGGGRTRCRGRLGGHPAPRRRCGRSAGAARSGRCRGGRQPAGQPARRVPEVHGPARRRPRQPEPASAAAGDRPAARRSGCGSSRSTATTEPPGTPATRPSPAPGPTSSSGSARSSAAAGTGARSGCRSRSRRRTRAAGCRSPAS